MESFIIDEPLLIFGKGKFICPRAGIKKLNPYDISAEDRPEKIRLGLIGIGESIDKIREWLELHKTIIPAKDSKQPKLFPAFCGFNEDVGFKARFVCSESEGYVRKIRQTNFDESLKEEHLSFRIQALIDLFLEHIEFLVQNKKPDVIICVLPEKDISLIWESTKKKRDKSGEDRKERDGDEKDEEQLELEQNFRRELKAKAMRYGVPIQIVRDRVVKPKSDMQDAATIGWNFFTALYYKAGGTPWALERDINKLSCYAGISFYKSRDKQKTETSVAQIFNEMGKGVILRGEPIQIDKYDKTPHLTKEQSYSLLKQALEEYKKAIQTLPQRLVIHKTSNFNEAEIEGFRNVAKDLGIYMVDLVTIQERTNLRLYRENLYPPARGTMISLDQKHHLLYTRGSVPYYETYAGSYIPSPLLIKVYQTEESPKLICEEILKLTKMNWNNTQFDGKLPITIGCARNVGEILKYLEEGQTPQLKYSFYM